MNSKLILAWSAIFSDSTKIAHGSIAADPDFFRIFSDEEKSLIKILIPLIGDSSSDYYKPLVALQQDRFSGFLFAYPLIEIFSRQTQSLRKLLEFSSDPRSLRPALTALAASKGKFKYADSFYLSRIYVEPAERGLGIAEAMMCEFEAEARRCGFMYLSLHVRRDNSSAQRLYSRLGFSYSDQLAGGYLSMEKQI